MTIEKYISEYDGVQIENLADALGGVSSLMVALDLDSITIEQINQFTSKLLERRDAICCYEMCINTAEFIGPNDLQICSDCMDMEITEHSGDRPKEDYRPIETK